MHALNTLPDVLALRCVPIRDSRRLPDVPGLYFVVTDQDQLLYIGMSAMSLRYRWRTSGRLGTFLKRGAARIAYLELDEGDNIRGLERDAIRRFAPPMNAAHQPGIVGIPAGQHWGPPFPPPDPSLLHASEVARDLGVAISTVLRWFREGRIPGHEVTKPWYSYKRYKFRLSEVRAALDALSKPGGPRPAP